MFPCLPWDVIRSWSLILKDMFSQNDHQKMTFVVICSGWYCTVVNSSAKPLTRGWGYQMCRLSRRMLYPVSSLTVQEKCWRDLDKSRQIQWGPARWWCGLKHLSFEVRQWDWFSFSLEKGRLPRDMITARQYLRRLSRRWSQVLYSDRWQESRDVKLK